MKKIKVVFVHAMLVCGGAEQALYDLITLLDKNIFEVSVLVLVSGGEWEQKFRDAGIHLVYCFKKRESGCTPGEFIRHQLRKARLYAYILLKGGQGIVDWLFPEGVDLIVDYSTWTEKYLAFSKNAKTIKFIHGDVLNDKNYGPYILSIKNILPRYDKIVCISQKAHDAFTKATGIEENVELHYNPINSANIRVMAGKTVLFPDSIPVVCAVGRLAPEKGYIRLVKIHKQLLNNGVIHKLVIVGDGPQRKEIERTIQEVEATDSVIMVGYQENPYPYIKNSYFMVCSSYTEGLPVTTMEALSLGIPVVSSYPSIGEAFGDECCGIITENNDESLYKGMEKMLTDEPFYGMAKHGAEERSAYFDGRRMVHEMETLFTELVQTV